MSLAASFSGFRLEAQTKTCLTAVLAKESHVTSGVLFRIPASSAGQLASQQLAKGSHVASGVLYRIPASGAGKTRPTAVLPEGSHVTSVAPPGPRLVAQAKTCLTAVLGPSSKLGPRSRRTHQGRKSGR